MTEARRGRLGEEELPCLLQPATEASSVAEQNSPRYHEESQSPYASPLQLTVGRDRLGLEWCPGDSHGGGLAQADRVRDEPRYIETDDEEKKPSTRLHSSRVSGQRIIYSALAPPHSRSGQVSVKQSIE